MGVPELAVRTTKRLHIRDQVGYKAHFEARGKKVAVWAFQKGGFVKCTFDLNSWEQRSKREIPGVVEWLEWLARIHPQMERRARQPENTRDEWDLATPWLVSSLFTADLLDCEIFDTTRRDRPWWETCNTGWVYSLLRRCWSCGKKLDDAFPGDVVPDRNKDTWCIECARESS